MPRAVGPQQLPAPPGAGWGWGRGCTCGVWATYRGFCYPGVAQGKGLHPVVFKEQRQSSCGSGKVRAGDTE